MMSFWDYRTRLRGLSLLLKRGSGRGSLTGLWAPATSARVGPLDGRRQYGCPISTTRGPGCSAAGRLCPPGASAMAVCTPAVRTGIVRGDGGVGAWTRPSSCCLRATRPAYTTSRPGRAHGPTDRPAGRAHDRTDRQHRGHRERADREGALRRRVDQQLSVDGHGLADTLPIHPLSVRLVDATQPSSDGRFRSVQVGQGRPLLSACRPIMLVHAPDSFLL